MLQLLNIYNNKNTPSEKFIDSVTIYQQKARYFRILHGKFDGKWELRAGAMAFFQIEVVDDPYWHRRVKVNRGC